MKRFLVFALLLSAGNTSLVFAEESLLSAGARHVQQMSRSEAAPGAGTSTTAVTPSIPLGSGFSAPALQGGAPRTLQSSGMKKSTKWLIAAGAAAVFVGSVYAIDSRVEDSTPSTLGTRRD